MKRFSTTSLPALKLLVLLLAPLMAQAQSGNALDNALQQMSESGELGDAGKPQVIERPAQVRYELGAVVDVRQPSSQGLAVLAVTPGSAAARLSLQPGDRLLALNGQRLDGTAPPAPLLQQALAAGNGKLAIQASRTGQPLQLSGQADVSGIPAYRLVVGADGGKQCGYVTSHFGTVPRSEGIFDAEITQIDGVSTPIDPSNQFRLAAGPHVLTVAEHIDQNRLNSSQLQQIAKMKKFAYDRAYKKLVVAVKPGVSYRIGARLLRDKLDTRSIQRNEYWGPLVWQEVPQRCP